MSTARKQKELRRSRKRSARIFFLSACFGLVTLFVLLVVAGIMDPVKPDPGKMGSGEVNYVNTSAGPNQLFKTPKDKLDREK